MRHYDKTNPKPEIIIGLAGPAGTELAAIATDLSEQLRAYKYHTIHVKVSALLKQWCSAEVRNAINSAKENRRVDYSMNAADVLRETVGTGAALRHFELTHKRFQRFGQAPFIVRNATLGR